MKESNLNSLIVKNFEAEKGFVHKISDSACHGVSGKRPFDGFAILNSFQYYYETKSLSEYKAFRFRELEEHQITNLCSINRNSIFTTPMIIVGIYLERVGFDLFFIKPDMKAWKMRCSIPKKQLEELRDKELYLPLRKKRFEVLKIPAKLIEVRPYKLNGKPRVETLYFEEEDDYAESLLED